MDQMQTHKQNSLLQNVLLKTNKPIHYKQSAGEETKQAPTPHRRYASFCRFMLAVVMLHLALKLKSTCLVSRTDQKGGYLLCFKDAYM